MANNNNNWKRIGGFSRTGTQNYVRTNDAAMGGTIFGSTDVSNNVGNTTLRIGNNAGVVYINGDIDMSGGVNVGAPINRIRNVRDPIADQDVATKFYVDERVDAIVMGDMVTGPTGPEGPPGIGIGGQNGSDGPMGHTGPTGPLGATGSSFGVKGPTGERGGTGSTGANGAAGATGAVGPVGEKGEQGIQGTQGIQGSNGTILWLNPDGDSPTNQLITDSYLLSKVPINASVRTVGPISVSATYGNVNKIIPASRFFNTAVEVSTLAVIPSGVWVVNLYANVPSNSDANQVALYAAVFMISGTTNQPSPDSLVIETKDGGDAGYYPPRAAYLPDHVKYIGKSWGSTDNVLISNTDTANKGVIIDGTSRKLYKLEMPVEFITLQDASGNRENVYVQLQIYVRNTKEANQTANVSLYFQTDATTNETTYSYLQTTFGAVGIQGIPGSTGSTGSKGENGLIGPAGPAGATGSAGPTGIAGPVGPRGSQGPTGVTGPEGSSNSYGVQYAVQYRGNQSTGDTDNSGNFRGDTNFRYIPTGYLNRLTDATAGSIVLNDLACNSIHSPVYVQDTSIVVGSGTTRPRTYIRGGELVNSGSDAEQSNYVVLASGTDTTNGNNSKTAVSVNDITNGIKMIHNYGTKKVTFQVHDENKASGTVGLQFDLSGSAVLGNISAAQDQFCIVNSSGAAGVGGITAAQLSASTYTTMNRMLHVRGNVMVGSDPGGVNAASNAMVLLNKSTSTPSGLLSGYPGVYHRQIASGDVTALGGATNSIATGGEGLGFISPNFITFQTGSSLQNNSIVINQAGVVSVTGRTNLNGAVTVNKNFGEVETHASLAPVMDISGTLSVSTGAQDFTDVPRIKLISRGIAANSAIPSATTTASSNEIRGVSTNVTPDGLISGFLRLSAQTPAHSCIDLIGLNTSASAYNNAVRINTGGTERMIVNGSGNVGIGTNAPAAPLDVVGNAIMRNSVRIGSTTAPSVPLDVAGAAKITGNLDMNSTGKIVNLVNPTAAQDAATRGYVDGRFNNASITNNLNMNNTRVYNLNEPALATDAATKGYVDGLGPTVTRVDSEDYVHSLALIRVDTISSVNGGITRTNLRASRAGSLGGPTFNPATQKLSLAGDLDVAGAANVSNYLSVGSGGSGSGTTTSTLPNAFYVRTGGGSNWRDFIPLLVADSTTNIIIWGGPDQQWHNVNAAESNEIAKQYSYFAAYWLNANRAVVGTSFTVESFAGTGNNPPTSSRGFFTFRATAVTNGIVTAYEGQLSAYNGSYYNLTPQQDGIDAGFARRSLSNRTLLMGGSVETGYLGVTGIVKVNASSATATALTTTGRIGVNTATPRMELDVVGQMRVSEVFATQIRLGSSYIGDTNYVYNNISYNYNDNVFTIGSDRQYSKISLDVYGRNRMTITTTQDNYTRVGIGLGISTDIPLDTLEVAGTGRFRSWVGVNDNGNTRRTINFPLHVFGSFQGQLNTNGPTQMGVNTHFLQAGSSIRGISICAQEGDVAAYNFAAYSDKRIKKNIHPLQPNKCVEMIRDLSPVSYKYIDYITNSSCSMYGFIAQDVKKHIPDAISYKTDYIPNLYSQVKLSKYSDDITNTDTAALWKVSLITSYTETGIFTFCPNKDNSGNEYVSADGSPLSDSLGNQKFKIKFITYDSSGGKNEIICYTHKLINDTEFIIDVTSINNESSSQTTYKYSFEEKEYFLYGQEVPDFHILTYDYLWSVFSASLKEVDRQQQADKARIAELENQVSNLESTVAYQQSLINDILERLKSNGM